MPRPTIKLREKTLEISPNQMIQAQEMRCPGCGRFLGYQAILLGIIKLKCPNCKEWTTLDINPEHEI